MPEDTQDIQVQDPAESASSAEEQAAELQDKIAAGSEPAKAGESDQQEEEKKGRLQRRFDTLTARAKQAEARAQEAERKLAERQAAESVKPAETRTKPKPGDLDKNGQSKYATYEDFVEDLADWRADQRTAALRAELQQAESTRKAQTETQTMQAAWQQRVEAAREQHADFDKVAFAEDSPVRLIPEGSAMDAYILRAPNGAELLYHLAENEDEITRIVALGPFEQVAELVKLELKLAPPESAGEGEEGGEKPAKPAIPISKAPTPPNPVRRPAGTSKAFNPMDSATWTDHEDYVRKMEAWEKRNGGR